MGLSGLVRPVFWVIVWGEGLTSELHLANEGIVTSGVSEIGDGRPC